MDQIVLEAYEQTIKLFDEVMVENAKYERWARLRQEDKQRLAKRIETIEAIMRGLAGGHSLEVMLKNMNLDKWFFKDSIHTQKSSLEINSNTQV